MCVHENVGAKRGKHGVECKCISTVTLDEVTVQVQISCVPAEAIFCWAILIGTRATISPKAPSYIVHGDNAYADVFGQATFCEQRGGPGDGGVDATGFTGMDGIVDEDFELGIFGPHCEQVQGATHIRGPKFTELR